MPNMRLDRFFSSQEILSRTDIKQYVKTGRIKVNSVVAKKADQKINTDIDVVSLDGIDIPYKPYLYIMLNKPTGVVSSTDDKLNKTVLDLVPPHLFRSDLFPAGRLDKDTTGFVILTNNGDFAHSILSPKSHVKKHYEVLLDKAITDEEIKQLELGVTLADGYVCLPCEIARINNEEQPLLSVILHEGKYHQIKRMFGVVGCGVNALKRTQIGDIVLDPTLPLGECREMLHKEVQSFL